MRLPVRAIALSLCLSVCVLPALAQTKKSKANTEEADAEAAQQRTIAISLVTTLADEARSFKDREMLENTLPRNWVFLGKLGRRLGTTLCQLHQ